MSQLLACNVEGRPSFFLNCPVTPSVHNEEHVSNLTRATMCSNAVTEEVGEARNKPARKCSEQFAQGDQAGCNRKILMCMLRRDKCAWRNRARARREAAERQLRKHHLPVGKELMSGRELGKYLECQFKDRWPACRDKKPFTYQWRAGEGGELGTCEWVDEPCSFARVLTREYLDNGEVTVKLRIFVAGKP